MNSNLAEGGAAPLLDYYVQRPSADLPLLPVPESQRSYIPRFILVMFLSCCLFSVIANALLAEGWTAGLAVWGSAIALALLDLRARRRAGRQKQ